MISQEAVIGPYQIISELGMGGMAVVYRALDTRVNHEVALKILLPQFVNDETFLRRFIREGQNTKRLRHPNIVRTFDAGKIDGNYYIAMEVVEGSNLSQYVKDLGTVLSFSDTIDILSQIAGSLDYAHSLGFLHRDIKLTNILMSDDGRVLLSDFGAAKQISADYTMLTAAGQSIGTPSYMSPEQARAEINLDFRTDVYSLGVVAYKLFTGRMPFTADNQAELLYKIVYEDVPDPQLYNSEVPVPIANVLRRVLSKQPGTRYESAGAFVGAIVASKRWSLNVAENFSATQTTQVSGVETRTTWRGLYLSGAALTCVIVLLTFASAVQTQDEPALDVSHLVGDETTPHVQALPESVSESLRESINESIDGLDFSQIDFSNIDLSEIDLSGIDLSEINLSGIDLSEVDFLPVDMAQLPVDEDGNLDIGNLDLSAEQLKTLLANIPSTERITILRRSGLFEKSGQPIAPITPKLPIPRS